MPHPIEPPLSAVQIAKVRASFAAQSMMQTLGASLVDVASGSCVIAAPILAGSRQQQGLAHAGLTFSIGDSAAGYAALTLLEDNAEVVTAEMKINLLAPGSGDRLVAEGHVIKPGKRLIVAQSDVYAESEGARRHIATLIGTLVPVAAA